MKNVLSVGKINDISLRNQIQEIEQEFKRTMERVYPVGSFYFNSSNTDPAELMGFGEWTYLGQNILGQNEHGWKRTA